MITPIVFFLRALAVVLKFVALIILAALYCALEFGEMLIHDLGEPAFDVLGGFIETMDSHISTSKKKELVRA